MRYLVMVGVLLVAGCGSDVQYGGGLHSDESNAAPEGGHATYADQPNLPHRDEPLWYQPQPAGADLPPAGPEPKR